MANRKGPARYGVIASDTSQELTRDFNQEIESRLTIASPRGDGSSISLVTRLRKDGLYEFRVEDESRLAHFEAHGNLYDDTGHQRPAQEG